MTDNLGFKIEVRIKNVELIQCGRYFWRAVFQVNEALKLFCFGGNFYVNFNSCL